MSSEIIVILVLVAFAVVGLIYLESNSRRHARAADQKTDSVENE